MKSIYDSAKNIMERLGASGAAQVKKPDYNPRMSPTVKAQQASKQPSQAEIDRQDAIASQKELNTPAGKAAELKRIAAANKPQATKPQAVAVPAATSKSKASVAPAPKTNITRSMEKSGPDTDAMKKNIAAAPAAPAAPAKAEEPKAAPSEPDSVEVTNKEASATKPNDSGGMRGNFSTVKGSSDSNEPSKPSDSPMAGIKSSNAEKPQASMSAPASSERQDVKDRSGNTVRDSSGNPVKTRSADEIERDNKKGRGRGMSMESVNKKFNVSDALYQSVMEVMKKGSKEGSVPRNEKEKDLAKFHGDPNRITHGDVLKARGVTKEEAEQVDEMSSKMKMKLGLYGKKKKTNEETVEEGMGSAAKSMAKKVLSKLGGGSDEDQLKNLQKKMGVPQTGKKPVKENKDTPGNSYEHQCAVHVKSESFGEGRTVTTQHAEPDADGNIAWYDVMFEHGIEKQVPTSDLEILVSEMHMHSKRKKKSM